MFGPPPAIQPHVEKQNEDKYEAQIRYNGWLMEPFVLWRSEDTFTTWDLAWHAAATRMLSKLIDLFSS